MARVMDANVDVDQFLKDAQVMAPPENTEAAAQKPPSLSLSMSFKDAPPEIQTQIEQAFGFQPASPQSHLVNKVGHGQLAGGASPPARAAQSNEEISSPS
jgi:hypothetical protein